MKKALPDPAMTAITLVFFTTSMDSTIVNAISPILARDLQASITALAWVIDAYLLAFAACIIVAGHLVDRFGARYLAITGLAIFTAASALCGLASGIDTLILFRAIKGVGSALFFPAALVLIGQAYVNAEQRAQVIALSAAWASLGAGLGPLIGILVTSQSSWSGIFILNIPIGLLALSLLHYSRASEHTVRACRPAPPQTGHLLLTVAFTGMLAFMLIGLARPATPRVETLAAAGALVLLTVLLIRSEARADTKILPVCLIKSGSFVFSCAIGTLTSFAFYGLLFIIPVYFFWKTGGSFIGSSLHLLPLSLSPLAGNLLYHMLATRLTLHTATVSGLSLAMAGYGTTAVSIHFDLTVGALLALFVAGTGSAACSPGIFALLVRDIHHHRHGIANALFNACRQLGALTGVALAAMLFSTLDNEVFAFSLFLTTSTAGIVISLVALLMIDHRPLPT
jgi:DHA2 family methylenomycin A resistance protein-like MFS transporter